MEMLSLKNLFQAIFGASVVPQEEKVPVPQVEVLPATPPVTYVPQVNSKEAISTYAIGEDFCPSYRYAMDLGGQLYIWDCGFYRPINERAMGKLVTEYLEGRGQGPLWSSHGVREVMKYIQTSARLLWEIPPLDEVLLENGILNLRTKTFGPWSPDWLSPIKIPVSYNPDATCPEIDKFIASIFPKDAIDLAYELAADLLTPDRSIQKAILLYGTGGNGKSTFLCLLSRFIGSCNISNYTLHNWSQMNLLPQDCVENLPIFVQISPPRA